MCGGMRSAWSGVNSLAGMELTKYAAKPGSTRLCLPSVLRWEAGAIMSGLFHGYWGSNSGPDDVGKYFCQLIYLQALSFKSVHPLRISPGGPDSQKQANSCL